MRSRLSNSFYFGAHMFYSSKRASCSTSLALQYVPPKHRVAQCVRRRKSQLTTLIHFSRARSGGCHVFLHSTSRPPTLRVQCCSSLVPPAPDPVYNHSWYSRSLPFRGQFLAILLESLREMVLRWFGSGAGDGISATTEQYPWRRDHCCRWARAKEVRMWREH
ncbi:hypothetical protein BDV96DRAFT_107427 [Lophiotrema nucula]|uniref:Uncharacterized protein n=1 Tax=Lophiotrema nucula TaxID=690887 RepID=A0A6A5Z4V5_9PLEO|nr:hypothetical protein BDV96DRAFT_107427 [Lophiotrema nucula]